MICPNCGTPNNSDRKLCDKCGTVLDTAAAADLSNAPSMKWYKFLIWVVFTVAPVISIISGLQSFDGMRISVNGYFAYETAEFFAPNIANGVLAIALACFALYVRFQLTGYKKNAPSLVTGYFAAGAVVMTVITLWYVDILRVYYYRASLDIVPSLLWQLGVSVILAVVMIVINIFYFKKRKQLFVN